MAKRSHRKTAGGKPITDDDVAKATERAEAGFDVEETDPALPATLAERAEHEDETTSAVICRALRSYLKTG